MLQEKRSSRKWVEYCICAWNCIGTCCMCSVHAIWYAQVCFTMSFYCIFCCITIISVELFDSLLWFLMEFECIWVRSEAELKWFIFLLHVAVGYQRWWHSSPNSVKNLHQCVLQLQRQLLNFDALISTHGVFKRLLLLKSNWRYGSVSCNHYYSVYSNGKLPFISSFLAQVPPICRV